MTFALTSAGLQIQNQAEIVAELEQSLKTATQSDGITLAFGANWITTPDSLDGQLIHNFAEHYADAQAAVAEVYASIGPGAQGKTLDNVMVLAGVPRKTPTKSRVVATISAGALGATVPAETTFKTSDTGAQFATTADVVVPALGTAPANCEALEAGPISATAGTLTVIVTPVAGMTAVTNAADAVLGQAYEEDPDYRIRHLNSLALPGTRTIDAMRGALLQLDGVTEARVFENVTWVPDVDGLPGKAIWAVVQGGDEQEIADEIFVRKCDGVETFGTITKTVTDSQGGTDTVKFGRPTTVPIYMVVAMSPAATAGEITTCKALLIAAITDPTTGLKISEDVSQFRMLCAIADTFKYKSSITLTTGLLAGLGDQGVITLAIGRTERATTDAAKITVT